MEESNKVDELIETMNQNSKSDKEIIEVLRNIIKQQLLYGGLLIDKIMSYIVKYKRK